MTVDNRLETAKLKNYYMLMSAVIFSLLAFYFFERSANIGYLIGALVFVFVYIFFLFRKSDYFYLEYNGNKIIVRYYTAHPFLRKYRAFEIPKAYFFDYKIKKQAWGLLKTIQFEIKTPKGMFKYPPVSISLFPKKKEERLIKILEEIKAS